MLRIWASRPSTYSSDCDHVRRPVEEHVDVRRTAAGGRTDVDRAGDVLHRLFDRPRDGGHHLVGRHDAVVDQDHDAGKVGLGKDRRGHRQAAYTPATHKAAARNRIALRWRSTSGSREEESMRQMERPVGKDHMWVRSKGVIKESGGTAAA